MKVVSTEALTVPAGTFKAFKLDVGSAEGEPGTMTVWIAADTRTVLKMVATLPDMGGATLTAELTKAGGTR